MTPEEIQRLMARYTLEELRRQEYRSRQRYEYELGKALQKLVTREAKVSDCNATAPQLSEAFVRLQARAQKIRRRSVG